MKINLTINPKPLKLLNGPSIYSRVYNGSVEFEGDSSLIGSFVNVEITDAFDYDLIGRATEA